ncbi:MAG TPA: response regulator transcription factor [Xanthobacteraceae bacterium]|jgi:DNA-binding response OmpR family regulator|nr:response regulator transcription factor [Xanthobacteraceae bacterium]
MHGKIQELSDGVGYSRETLATVSQLLRSIHDTDISRPLPGHFARLLNELGPDSLTIIEGVHVDDRVCGSRAGGDDDLTRPFATVELIAGLEALLRRSAESRDTVLQVGPLALDLIERTAKRGERTIDLLPREFRLLEYMMRRKEQTLTRAMLLQEVWNYKFVPESNLVDVRMGRLRRKVDAPHEPPMIYNARGVGFILRVPV